MGDRIDGRVNKKIGKRQEENLRPLKRIDLVKIVSRNHSIISILRYSKLDYTL